MNFAGIVIPDSVTEIGDGAFSGCTGLTGIVIPRSVTKFGCVAFEKCTALKNIKIPKDIEYIEGDFWGCENLKIEEY